MQRLLFTAITAWFIAAVLGPIVIPWLRKMHFGQTIYELGPEEHRKKQGTPNMGGLIFMGASVPAALAFAYNDSRFGFHMMILICALCFGMVGFADDWLKVSRKRSEGLKPMQKIVPQFVIAVGMSVWAYFTPSIGSKLIVPFFNVEWDLGIFYIPVMIFILVGTVNSANLLDGLDGLCAGCSMIDFITMLVIAVTMASAAGDQSSNLMNVAVIAAAIAGALMCYLRFAVYPARTFMGDAGAFYLGGALVGMALVTRLSLILPIIALAMFASSVSDIIQIGYFKYTRIKTGTGKRIFRMAPLHHHFEKGGMPETRVVMMYYSVTLLLCMFALLGFLK